MRFINYLSLLLQPNRLISGRSQNEHFWFELDKVVFLLKNLKEDELNWSQVDFYLRAVHRLQHNQEVKAELRTTAGVFLAWLSIAIQIEALKDHELDPHWMERFKVVGDHLTDRLLPSMPAELILQFEALLPSFYWLTNRKYPIDIEGIKYV